MSSAKSPVANLQSTLDNLPEQPGVYLMKSAGGDILYIGKARVLADRVRSYFQTGADVTPKTQLLVAQIGEIETIVTRSDLEALILESNLIKRHRPKFNVVLRDDKQYPYLRLPIKESFPRLSIVRRVQKDGALYFGPYTPSGALRETLRVIRKVFPLATCDITIDGTADRACLEFEIKRQSDQSDKRDRNNGILVYYFFGQFCFICFYAHKNSKPKLKSRNPYHPQSFQIQKHYTCTTHTKCL